MSVADIALPAYTNTSDNPMWESSVKGGSAAGNNGAGAGTSDGWGDEGMAYSRMPGAGGAGPMGVATSASERTGSAGRRYFSRFDSSKLRVQI